MILSAIDGTIYCSKKLNQEELTNFLSGSSEIVCTSTEIEESLTELNLPEWIIYEGIIKKNRICHLRSAFSYRYLSSVEYQLVIKI